MSPTSIFTSIQRAGIVLCAAMALAGTMMLSPASPVGRTASAEAEYYWGCAYSGKEMCTGRGESLYKVEAMDERQAYIQEDVNGRYPQGGARRPKGNNNEQVDICAGGMYPQGHMLDGTGGEWACTTTLAYNEFSPQFLYPVLTTQYSIPSQYLYEVEN